eukprot:2186064-Prymnesium_polylepis.1
MRRGPGRRHDTADSRQSQSTRAYTAAHGATGDDGATLQHTSQINKTPNKTQGTTAHIMMRCAATNGTAARPAALRAARRAVPDRTRQTTAARTREPTETAQAAQTFSSCPWRHDMGPWRREAARDRARAAAHGWSSHRRQT